MCSQPETSIDSQPAIWADRVGIWASTLCVIHCLLTPVLLSMSAVVVDFLPSEEWVHRSLALFIALIGAIALLRGFRTHRRATVIGLMACGLACIFVGAYQGDRLPSHLAEVAVTFLGSALMISAHRLNHTFCKDCACSKG